MSLSEQELRIAGFNEAHPERTMGPHVTGEGSYRIVAYLPRAENAWIENSPEGSVVNMKRSGNGKTFRAEVKKSEFRRNYLICFTEKSGYTEKREDPYSFPATVSDYDVYLFKKGEFLKSYETFGAHFEERDGVAGVRFTVWAPTARAVSVIADFNHWIAGATPMTNVSDSGIWEVFVPRVTGGEVYKYAIRTGSGKVLDKADPYAFRTELRPRTGSVVSPLNYDWKDNRWVEERKRWNFYEEPLLIYEMHLGSWRRPGENPREFLNYRDIADQLIPYLKDLGYTHVELMPVMEHPFDGSWGYQVVSYYSPTSRYGTPEDFMYFVDQCHVNGIGVILDWVPAHFPSDEYGLSNFDGTHLYDHEDPRRGFHPDWGTRIFNYGRNEVRAFLSSNAVFWLEKYHIDGIRIDAVSSMLYLDYSRKKGEWLPNIHGGRENLEAIDFIKYLNRSIHDNYPGVITVAEESTAWGGVTIPHYQGGLGFDFKWNMGWMHDTLYYFSRDPVYRKHEHNNLTFSAWYAFSEKFILPLSHDEVVHMKGSMLNKMPGDRWQKFANLRLLYTYMIGSPGKKLHFMGDEFGQPKEWSVDGTLQWELLNEPMHNSLMHLVKDLNRLYRSMPQLYQGDCSPPGFQWIDFKDTENSVISFYRFSEEGKKSALFVFNMTPVPRYRYRIGVDQEGVYKEMLNSDAKEYGGSGVGNLGSVKSERKPSHGRKYSISLTLPPLAGEIFVLSVEGT